MLSCHSSFQEKLRISDFPFTYWLILNQIFAILISSLFIQTVHAQVPIATSTPPLPQISIENAIRETVVPNLVIVTPPLLTNKEKAFLLVKKYAPLYGADETMMMRVMECESGYDPLNIGDHNTSFGLVQIHLPAHPEVTRAMAEDPDFAVKFLAAGLTSGHKRWWSCYRILYEGMVQ